jgi:hypothetical protein
VDIDLGEFFLNFPLPQILQEYSGIDLTPFLELLTGLGFVLIGDADGLVKVCWEKYWMGCKPSPYVAVHFYYWAEEFARGFHGDPETFLRWDWVVLNLNHVMVFASSKTRETETTQRCITRYIWQSDVHCVE